MTAIVTLCVFSPSEDLKPDLAVLNHEERTRADRFTVDHPRRVFITGRAALRRALGSRLGQDPSTLHFSTGDHGKPSLTPTSSLKFNLSHSGNTIIIAMTEDIDLGVDVEEFGRDTPTLRLAERFFADAESTAVEQAQGADRNRVFFHCWTAKEAVLKATGSGLSVPVREVVVDPNPNVPPRILTLGGDRAEATHWTLLRYEVLNRWIATVAFRGSKRTLVVDQSAPPHLT